MIPLRLSAELEGAEGSPFVVKLLRNDASDSRSTCLESLDNHFGVLAAELPGRLVFDTVRGYLSIHGVSFEDVEGDVLYVDTTRQVAHRWIRSRSRHNTLLVTERCDQLCVMCSQPPKRHHADMFDQMKTAAKLAPLGAEIGISGGEPTLYKDGLFDFISEVSEARPDLGFHVLTNAQHFAEGDLPRLRASRQQKVCWGVPIYAPDAETHDYIVGKEGAFGGLLGSLSILMRAGASVELRTVVMRPNAIVLAELAWFVSTHLGFAHIWAIMQLENIGFARKRWDELFFDHSKDFSPIADAVDVASLRGSDVALYNFPLCTVPPGYRRLAGRTISDWKQRYLPKCAACSERFSCCGFFEWYPGGRGFKEVNPL